MKKNQYITIGILIIAVAVFFIFNSGNDSQPQVDDNTDSSGVLGIEKPSSDLSSSFNFSLEDYNVRTVTAADFAGKPLVVNAWATWCPFCIDELPDFATVQEELGDQVVFITINRSESLKRAQQYSDERLGLGDKLVWLLDPDDSFYRGIGGFAMPETIFVTPDRAIQFHKRGPMDLQEIRLRTEALLNSQK